MSGTTYGLPSRPGHKRTGRDTLNDLADAPVRLRVLADWFDVKDNTDHPMAPLAADRRVQADLRRWSWAIDEILSFKMWKAYATLAYACGAGFAVGVFMMVMFR